MNFKIKIHFNSNQIKVELKFWIIKSIIKLSQAEILKILKIFGEVQVKHQPQNLWNFFFLGMWNPREIQQVDSRLQFELFCDILVYNWLIFFLSAFYSRCGSNQNQNQIKPNQTRSDPIKSNKADQNKSKSNQTRSGLIQLPTRISWKKFPSLKQNEIL